MADKATVDVTTFDSNFQIFYLNSSTLAPTGQNIFCQLLGGPDAAHLSAVTDSAGNAISIAMGGGGAGPGNFDLGAGLVPGVADNAQASFQLLAWKGTGGFAAATEKVSSAVWQQGTGSWNSTAQPPAAVVGVSLNIPGNLTIIPTVVPEPSTIALGLLGGLALLIRRRK